MEIRQKWLAVIEAACTLLGLASLGLAGWYGWGDVDRNAITLLTLGVIFVAFSPLSTALFKIKTEAATARREASEDTLDMLVELTHKLCEIDEEHDLRVTLMKVRTSHEPHQLAQVARYGCSGRQNPGTSSMTIHQGVAGLSLRKMNGKVESLIVNVDVDNFDDEMVVLGFTKEQAKKFNRRGAYLCTPIVNSMGEGIAVLCLDTKDSEVFTPVHTGVAERMTPFFSRSLTATERSGWENG